MTREEFLNLKIGDKVINVSDEEEDIFIGNVYTIVRINDSTIRSYSDAICFRDEASILRNRPYESYSIYRKIKKEAEPTTKYEPVTYLDIFFK